MKVSRLIFTIAIFSDLIYAIKSIKFKELFCKEFIRTQDYKYLMYVPELKVLNSIPVLKNKKVFGSLLLTTMKNMQLSSHVSLLHIDHKHRIRITIDNVPYFSCILDENEVTLTLEPDELNMEYSSGMLYSYSKENNSYRHLHLFEHDTDDARSLITTINTLPAYLGLEDKFDTIIIVLPFNKHSEQVPYDILLLLDGFYLNEQDDNLFRENHEGSKQYINFDSNTKSFTISPIEQEAAMAKYSSSRGILFRYDAFVYVFDTLNHDTSIYSYSDIMNIRDSLYKIGDRLHYKGISIGSASLMPVGDHQWLKLELALEPGTTFSHNVILKTTYYKNSATKFFRDLDGDWCAIQSDSKSYLLWFDMKEYHKIKYALLSSCLYITPSYIGDGSLILLEERPINSERHFEPALKIDDKYYITTIGKWIHLSIEKMRLKVSTVSKRRFATKLTHTSRGIMEAWNPDRTSFFVTIQRGGRFSIKSEHKKDCYDDGDRGKDPDHNERENSCSNHYQQSSCCFCKENLQLGIESY